MDDLLWEVNDVPNDPDAVDAVITPESPHLERLRQAISEALDLLDHDQKHGAAAILRAVLQR